MDTIKELDLALFAENQKRQDVERQLAEAIAARQAAQRELVQVIEETQRRAEVLIKEAFRRGVESEREACAQVCESRATPGTGSDAILNGAADAIRERSNKV